MARAILLGGLRPAGRVEIVMNARISQKKRWVVTRVAFDRMLAELHPDIERAGEQYEKIRQKLVKCVPAASPREKENICAPALAFVFAWHRIGAIASYESELSESGLDRLMIIIKTAL